MVPTNGVLPLTSHPPAREKKRLNKVSHVMFLQVADALVENIAKFRQEHPSYDTAAEFLSEILGFKINHSHVKQACEAKKLFWDGPKMSKKAKAMDLQSKELQASMASKFDVVIAELKNSSADVNSRMEAAITDLGMHARTMREAQHMIKAQAKDLRTLLHLVTLDLKELHEKLGNPISTKLRTVIDNLSRDNAPQTKKC